MRNTYLLVMVLMTMSLGVYAQEHHGDHHYESMAPEADSMGHHMTDEASSVGEDLGVCPVMGGQATKEYSYTHEGKTYYFCCPSCIEEFKKDPQKYISKIKEFKIEAYQFGYEPKVIQVRQGDVVRLLGGSRDVAHGIYIKEYNINERVTKGDVKKIEFIAKRKGEFDILCSVYCGRGHHAMKSMLIVN